MSNDLKVKSFRDKTRKLLNTKYAQHVAHSLRHFLQKAFSDLKRAFSDLMKNRQQFSIIEEPPTTFPCDIRAESQA